MGICKDKSTDYLNRLGYNVVRHPRDGIAPLGLVGKQNGSSAWLGSLDQILDQPAPPPSLESDLQAAAVNGKESSKLDIAIGVNILGALIGAMGGNLGVDTGYTNASTISFVFQDVLSDRVEPMTISNYLDSARLRASSPLLQEYVLGNGELFVITEAIKSNQFTVKFESNHGVEAKVDVPVIEELLGGKISLSASGDLQGVVTFTGKTPLVFGFRCLALGVLDGQLRLTLSKAGAVPLSVGEAVPGESFEILGEPGLLEVTDGQP